MRSRAATPVLTAVLSALALAACGASAQGTTASSPSAPAPTASSASALASAAPAPVTPVGPACATGAAEELAHTAGVVAQRIYAGELASSETGADKREVEEYEPLLNAMASGERGAIEAAVHHLVYSGTHIVRLRVMKGSTVLADIGGPYILAPVTGTLRQHGRTVGHYILSVQDDLGYVKLETRYIGVPMLLRRGATRIPLEGEIVRVQGRTARGRHILRAEYVEVFDLPDRSIHQRAQPRLAGGLVLTESRNLAKLRVSARVDHQVLRLTSR